jgi:hypothetical protein
MTDLVDQIKTSFERAGEALSEGPTVITPDDNSLAPGFMAMKEYYQSRLMLITRRGYRHYAGSNLTTDADALVERTSEFLNAPMIAVSMGAFADGLMIGHQNDHLVKMCVHFNNVDHLFHDDNFRQSSLKMAHGLAEDRAVCGYFNEYVQNSVRHMTHITGFAHSEVVPAKVWDIWMLAGAACVTASYLAGSRMGATWLERDVLDGIEIASESAGQDGPDQ